MEYLYFHRHRNPSIRPLCHVDSCRSSSWAGACLMWWYSEVELCIPTKIETHRSIKTAARYCSQALSCKTTAISMDFRSPVPCSLFCSERD